MRRNFVGKPNYKNGTEYVNANLTHDWLPVLIAIQQYYINPSFYGVKPEIEPSDAMTTAFMAPANVLQVRQYFINTLDQDNSPGLSNIQNLENLAKTIMSHRGNTTLTESQFQEIGSTFLPQNSSEKQKQLYKQIVTDAFRSIRIYQEEHKSTVVLK
jgi:hypothetical protein